MTYTTLGRIRKCNPCAKGWAKLRKHLRKTTGRTMRDVSLMTILESNGIDDAIWALRAVDGMDREIRLFAVWCARQVQHLMTDPRSLNALDVAERHANGEATEEELAVAWAAASAAAWAAARAASDAASAAAWAAARAASDAAWAAAWAASAAASDAAWAAAWAASDAALDAASEAARVAQRVEFMRVFCHTLEDA